MNTGRAYGFWAAVSLLGSFGCGQELRPAASPPSPPPLASSAPQGQSVVPQPPAAENPPREPSPSKGPLDAARVAASTGGKPETVDNVVKVTFARDDVKVDIDGWSKVPTFMGLTSWAAFIVDEKPGVEAMVMGDFVLFEDEVSPAMSAALDNGLAVTALHNHFFFDKPHVYFMHIGGEGGVEDLGKGIKAVLAAEKAVRAKAAQPATGFGGTPPKGPSQIDGEKVGNILGVTGQTSDGMYKATMGRKTRAVCGCTVGKTMGINTWAAFAGKDQDAVVDGDFAVAEVELQSVLKALRQGGIHVVAIHSHMTEESPRILFLHYWGRGKAVDLAATIKSALDLTVWDGRSPI
jgi:hypothetical protein